MEHLVSYLGLVLLGTNLLGIAAFKISPDLSHLDHWIHKRIGGKHIVTASVEFYRPGHHSLGSQMNHQRHTKTEILQSVMLQL